MMKNEPRKEERSYEWAGKKWVSREREILHDSLSYFFFFTSSFSLDFYSILIWRKKIKRRKNSVLPSVCTILSIRQFFSPFSSLLLPGLLFLWAQFLLSDFFLQSPSILLLFDWTIDTIVYYWHKVKRWGFKKDENQIFHTFLQGCRVQGRRKLMIRSESIWQSENEGRNHVRNQGRKIVQVKKDNQKGMRKRATKSVSKTGKDEWIWRVVAVILSEYFFLTKEIEFNVNDLQTLKVKES